jgi:hypothetical protein
MFNEYIYLDINRIQSVISQLQQGLLTEILTGKTKEGLGKVGFSDKAGFISQFLPISGEAQGKYISDIKQSKILHDYAFNIAIKSLEEEGFLLELEEMEREELPVPEDAFILVKGSLKIFDYKTLLRLVENKWVLSERSKLKEQTLSYPHGQGREQNRGQSKPRRQSSNDEIEANQYEALYETFYEDAIQINLTQQKNLTYIGFLIREHLREDIRTLIFKYGSELQGQWSMLAQISRIPPPIDFQNLFEEIEQRLARVLDRLDLENLKSGYEYFNVLLEAMNTFQESMNSVVFPNIAVSPIAIYREVHPLR